MLFIDDAKKSFYIVLLTAVFGKIDRIASEEVTLEKMKMYPHLTICIEAFLINKSEASSYVSTI